jgi:galactokinase/mevalonate kinase-like predicted kinase
VDDEEILHWLEEHLHLVPLGPRQSGFQVLKGARITPAKVRALASAADHCWDAIRKRNLAEFGRRFRESFEAQVSLFPKMADRNVRSAIALYAEKSLGWKLSGAGGGGYLVLVGRHDIRGAIKIKIRRKGQ